jgi:hypothetical protein
MERTMADLCDWVVDSACADHDVQNGLCKGCSLGHDKIKELTKSIFKGVRSVRDTYDKLMETLPAWVRSLEIDDEKYDEDAVLSFWLFWAPSVPRPRRWPRSTFDGNEVLFAATSPS